MAPDRLDVDARLARLGSWCMAGVSRGKTTRLERAAGERVSGESVTVVPAARDLALRSLELAEKIGAQVLLPGDADWPQAVDAVATPPGALFVRGTLPKQLGVAIVGARHATASGLGFAQALAEELAADGFPILSGGALGIDAAAHAGAIGRGPTVAVLGSGLDCLYPPQHLDLFRRIVETGGALVTEFPFGTPPLPGFFPRRNRLIAALAEAVVVVEAAVRSGSLSTARHALKLGRTLLAVPGTPGLATAEGTNELLKTGEAAMCTGAADVRRALGVPAAVPKKKHRVASESVGPTLGPTLDRIRTLLDLVPRSLDEIASAAGISAAEIAVRISELELLGLAHRAPGGTFYRPRESREST